MSTLIIALLLLLPPQQTAGEPVGAAEAGAAAWRAKFCANCHGDNAEGGFGPDLAGGRGLTWEQFRHQVRSPWGMMLSYTEQQLPDQMLADIQAFVKSKPKPAQPGHWHWAPAPSTSPLRQRLYMQTAGCGQCHEPEHRYGRAQLGGVAKDADFAYFAKLVYEHTEKWPNGAMGNYSRDRLPESILREIYDWMVDDLGMRPQMNGAIRLGSRQGEETTYSVTVTNVGVKDKGLTAEGLTVYLKVPQGTKVVSATGEGYAGVMAFSKLGLDPALALAPHPHDPSGHVEWPALDRSFDVAVWRVPRLVAAQAFGASLTIAGPLSPDVLQGFDGSAVYWETPGRRAAGSPPTMVYRDLRSPERGDHQRLALPQMPR
jgi:mono/diheme cytochrome c family protein